MKATEYVKQFKKEHLGPASAAWLICEELYKEGNQLAKTRGCSGLEGGTFGDCHSEQIKKWVAICRKWPELPVGYVNDYYQDKYPQLWTVMHGQKAFICLHSLLAERVLAKELERAVTEIKEESNWSLAN